MIFSNKRNPPNMQISFNDMTIDRVDHHNFLGVLIDNNLNFKYHIQHICSKVSKAVGILFKLSSYMPSNILKIIYHALVTPYITYCVTVWGCAPRYLINKLFIQQKKLVRIIAGATYFAHTDPLFSSLKILKLSDLYELRCLIFIFKVFNCVSNHYVIEYISSYQIPHNHETRNQIVRLPIVNLFKYRQSVIYKSVNLWNDLSVNIKSANSIYALKRLFSTCKFLKYDNQT